MGASKEGGMSVRERINLVLEEGSSLLPEGDEDPLSGGGGKDKDGDGSTFVSSSTSKSGGDGSGVESASGISSSSQAGPGGTILGNDDSIQDGESPSPSSTSSRSMMEIWMHQNVGAKFGSRMASEEVFQLDVHMIGALVRRVTEVEKRNEVLEKERDQLQSTINSERRERDILRRKNEALEEQRTKAETTVKEQEERIRELERQLAAASAPKPVVHKGTRMTPRSTPSDDLQEDEDAFPRKKRKLDNNELPAVTSRKLPKPTPSTFATFMQLHQNYLMGRGRSDSPPQLSPAVTPKSSSVNPSFMASAGRELMAFHPRDPLLDDDEDIPQYSPDEIQDELDRINCLSQRSREDGTRSHIAPSQRQRLLPSSSSAFSRPSPRRQTARVMFPEKKRFLSVSQSPLKSMQPFHQSSQPPSSTSSHLPKNSNSNSNETSHGSLAREPPQLISIRDNNFLNMSRPVARRPPVPYPPVSYPPSQGGTVSDERLNISRSLNSSLSDTLKPTDDSNATSDTPPVVKKRGVGRPPGSRPKKRVPATASSSHLGLSDTRFSNGVLEDSQPKSEPPAPRFSKRGRLLKPNRARYSPDPDVSSTQSQSRDKFMTTKKSYYVCEPFVPEGYGGSMDCSLSGDASLGALDSFSRQGLDDDEPLSPPARTSEKEGGEGDGTEKFVEVPQWRISIVEGFEDGEEREPPEDDMSDEAFLKRHQKPEVQEKQRKRWDLQMLREESYKERMQRKQAEREKQKELRRLQRKRKGRSGATEEEVVNPSVEDIKAIYIGDVLPVGAFGQTLPINEKVDFHFSSGCAASSPPLPSPKTVVTITIDNEKDANNTDVISCRNVKRRDTGNVVGEVDMPLETEMLAIEGRLRQPLATSSPPPLPSCSSPLALPSSPSPVPQASSPPPPVISCMRDNNDVYEYTEDDDSLLPIVPPSLTTLYPILERARNVSGKEKGKESPLPPPSLEEAKAPSEKAHPSITIPLSVPLIRGRGGGGCQVSTSTVLSSAASGISKGSSIKFFIPNNPLARTRPRLSSISSVSSGSSGYSSVKMSDEEQSCKDKNIQS